MKMIDTLKIRQNITDDEILRVKELATTKIKISDNSTLFFSIKTLRITVSENLLMIDFSVPKFWNGNNIYSLTRVQIENAFQSLQDSLSLDLSNAFVSRVDIAQTFRVKYPAKFYCEAILMQQGKKFQNYRPGTNVFDTRRVWAFYDKGEECKKKQIELPFELKGQNILRYEHRIKKDVRRVTKFTDLVFKDLTKPKVYNRLIEIWMKGYFDLQKEKVLLPPEIKLSSDLKNFLAYKGLESLGGYSSVLKLIDASRDVKLAKNYKRRSDMFSMLRKLNSNRKISKENKYVKELNEKITTCAFLNRT